MQIEPIALFKSPFGSKFGIPKQSNLVPALEGRIVMLPRWRNADALRGIEDFSYLWLVWGFSANKHAATSVMVRPPLLGGNQKMGVFATRSPFRPNPIGLSSVRLLGVDWDTPDGPVLRVGGADLMDSTPIYDIKPYVTYADCHPEARSGFVDEHPIDRYNVEIVPQVMPQLTPHDAEVLQQVLSLDPRPHYKAPSTRVYGMPYKHFDVKFTVEGHTVKVIGLSHRTQPGMKSP